MQKVTENSVKFLYVLYRPFMAFLHCIEPYSQNIFSAPVLLDRAFFGPNKAIRRTYFVQFYVFLGHF